MLPSPPARTVNSETTPSIARHGPSSIPRQESTTIVSATTTRTPAGSSAKIQFGGLVVPTSITTLMETRSQKSIRWGSIQKSASTLVVSSPGVTLDSDFPKRESRAHRVSTQQVTPSTVLANSYRIPSTSRINARQSQRREIKINAC